VSGGFIEGLTYRFKICVIPRNDGTSRRRNNILRKLHIILYIIIIIIMGGGGGGKIDLRMSRVGLISCSCITRVRRISSTRMTKILIKKKKKRRKINATTHDII